MKNRFSKGCALAWAAAFLAAAAAQAAELKLVGSPIVPAAEGSVKAEKVNNDNTNLEVRIKHMPIPSKLTPPENAYVLWARPSAPNARPQNLGRIAIGKDLTGSLQTTTPFHAFQVFITAEPSAAATDPTGQPLLWGNVTR